MPSANQPQRTSILDLLFWTGLGGMAVLILLQVVLGYFSPVRSYLRSLPQQRASASNRAAQPAPQQNAEQMAEAIAAGSGWTPEELAEIVRLDSQLEAKSWELYRRGVDSLRPDEKLLVYSLVKLPYARANRDQGLPLTDKERQILQFGDAYRIP